MIAVNAIARATASIAVMKIPDKIAGVMKPTHSQTRPNLFVPSRRG